jgi:membrane protease YdiL (CAAX protease family)
MAANCTLFVFFVLAYVWAWLVFVPMVIFHAPPQWTILATMGPTIAAVVTHRLAAGNYRAFRIRTTWLRMLGATVIGVALIVLAYVVLPSVTTGDPRQLHWSILTSVSVYNYSTLLGGPLFEEPGWRGFALPRLEARFGPLGASALLALLWAGWHLPLFFYPGWITAPPWIYLLIMIGATFLLTYGTNLARFGVITPIAMHAAFNTASRFLNGLFAGTAGPRVHIPFELVLALGGLATAAVLILVTRGRLAYHDDSPLSSSR